MQRLLEGDVRSASNTDSGLPPRPSTQASNFSFFRRSAAFAARDTVSIPNWRKHSASSARYGSFSPTMAVRARLRRGGALGERAEARAKFMFWGNSYGP